MVNIVKTIKEKYLTYALIILGIIVFIFLLGKIKINWTMLIIIAVALVAIWFFMREKKQDIYSVARKIQLKHYKHTGELLDLSKDSLRATEMPIGSGRLLINFGNNGKVFEYFNDVILGCQINEMRNIKSDMEKSRLVEQVTKQQSLREQLKESAKKMGIDPSSIGLGD